ncbi:phosphatidate cytidylyltransferase [Sphingobacterium sp. HJSM2_6]|uniref:phosphatidate cytidylyltransferase n=1 Tax=Sphingobacterium sp. HJSM2_6 TaxID=3366264 RepID=UPI003BD9013A
MKTRAITGIFFVLVLVAATLYNGYVFAAFFSLVGLFSTKEFYDISKNNQTKPLMAVGLLSSLLLSLLASAYFLNAISSKYLLLSIPCLSLVYLCSLFLKREQPFHDIAYTFLGVLYGTVPFIFFIGLGFISGTFNPYLPLGFLIMLWSNDTGAYLSGRAFGRTKLFERISPNKTWEGFVGGLALAVLVALNLQQYFGTLTKMEWATVAVLIGVFGTLGDLVESMLKRSLGIKDSGHILPGHGGFLDRFDGLLIAGPLVFVLLNML